MLAHPPNSSREAYPPTAGCWRRRVAKQQCPGRGAGVHSVIGRAQCPHRAVLQQVVFTSCPGCFQDIMGNNMFETTSLVLVKNVPHKILKSPIPLSNSNLKLQLKHSKTQTPNENVPHKILILGGADTSSDSALACARPADCPMGRRRPQGAATVLVLDC